MIAVLPAPVLPRSHTTGAVTWARARTCSISAGELPVSPKSASLTAFQSRFSATVERPPARRLSRKIHEKFSRLFRGLAIRQVDSCICNQLTMSLLEVEYEEAHRLGSHCVSIAGRGPRH